MGESKLRKIDELIDLPYSEMSEEEIDLVVEFKAGVKARDAAFTERMEVQRKASAEAIRINSEIAEIAKKQLDDIVAQAAERLKVVENG